MAAGLRLGSGVIAQISRAVPYIRAPASPGLGCLRRGDITDRGIQFHQHGGDMVDGLGGDESFAAISALVCGVALER
jgi:hypothetical protein